MASVAARARAARPDQGGRSDRRIADLERRRREMAAAYVRATRGHAPRAALAQKLVRATCAALRAEIKADEAARKAATAGPDLFSSVTGCTP